MSHMNKPFLQKCPLIPLLLGLTSPAFAEEEEVEAPAIPVTNLALVKLNKDGTPDVASWRAVTNAETYHNQPHFESNHSLLYTKQMEGQTDIWRYDVSKDEHSAVTETPESEYSATLMPGGERFSVIRVERDDSQRLWSFKLDGSSPEIVLHDVKPVGYHTWLDPDTLALFVLGEPMTLQLAKVSIDKAKVLDADIGRSLHTQPNTGFISYSVHREAQNEIRLYDTAKETSTRLTDTREEQQDYVWLTEQCLLMGEGNSLFKFCEGKGWQKVAEFEGVGAITRLAVNEDNSLLAVVHAPEA